MQTSKKAWASSILFEIITFCDKINPEIPMTIKYFHMRPLFKGCLLENFSNLSLEKQIRYILFEFHESMLRASSEINLGGEIIVKGKIWSFCHIFRIFKKKKLWSLSGSCFSFVVRPPSNNNRVLVCWLQVIFWGKLKMLWWGLELSWSFSCSHVVVSYSQDCCKDKKRATVWVLLDMKVCYQDFHSRTPARQQKNLESL